MGVAGMKCARGRRVAAEVEKVGEISESWEELSLLQGSACVCFLPVVSKGQLLLFAP